MASTADSTAVTTPFAQTTADPSQLSPVNGVQRTQQPHTSSSSSTQQSSTEETPLFSPTLISPTVSAALPQGYILRPLLRSDYHRGFLSVLSVLATVGTVSSAEWDARYDSMTARSGSYYILCVVDTSRPEEQSIVGTGTVLVERKFIHELGLVGHIEDIAVAKDQQGKKLGLRIIQALDFVAESVGCYKTILDCSEANEGFYVKCNFRRAGLEMARYYDMTGKKKTSHV